MGRSANTCKPEQKEEWPRCLAFVVTLDISKQGNPEFWRISFFAFSSFGYLGPNWISQLKAKLEFAKLTFLSLPCLGILAETGFPKSSRNWNLQNYGFYFFQFLSFGPKLDFTNHSKTGICQVDFFALPLFGDLGSHWISQIQPKLKFPKFIFCFSQF